MSLYKLVVPQRASCERQQACLHSLVSLEKSETTPLAFLTCQEDEPDPGERLPQQTPDLGEQRAPEAPQLLGGDAALLKGENLGGSYCGLGTLWFYLREVEA